MTPCVLDCSVVAAWFFPEEHDEYALAVMRAVHRGDAHCIAPDLLLVEFANVAWKKVRRGLAGQEEARSQFARFALLPIEYRSSESLLSGAFEVALAVGLTVYDSLYLTLAALEKCEIASSDQLLAARAGRLGVGLYPGG
jgi:predicted nucleic acid-binding protein